MDLNKERTLFCCYAEKYAAVLRTSLISPIN